MVRTSFVNFQQNEDEWIVWYSWLTDISLSLCVSVSHACTLLLCLHVHVCTDEVNTFWFMLHYLPKSLIDSWELFLPKRVFLFLNLFLSRSQVLTCMFLLAACCVFTVHTDPAEHGGKADSTVGQQAGCAGRCWEWETYLCMDIHCRIKKLFGKDNEVGMHGHVQDTVILDCAEAVALHRLTEFPDFLCVYMTKCQKVRKSWVKILTVSKVWSNYVVLVLHLECSEMAQKTVDTI